MSLLTPPSTKHRRSKDKENHDADSHFRVAWSEINKIHIVPLPGSPKSSTPRVSPSKNAPRKSILKKSGAVFSSWPEEKQRDMTPEPEDPLVNLTYLTYPISTITEANDTTELRVLIEAYSVLMNRLRASTLNKNDIDSSWPLFQPLRDHKDAFIDAVVRDLGRALVDPGQQAIEEGPAMRVLLPSPSNTPKKKKKDGMSAEQAKYARDLATTSHAVIRLLTLIFTVPCFLKFFTSADLEQMFTAALAIPLADELPTPNARKTWALAISLIQTQRLSSKVLAPAADRITLALCRGIDGELGKEGKKGSASDGLKAFHDLSIHLPSVFIPKFTHALLPSVLANLLAPTLPLRIQAAHALGGFVLGLTSLPPSSVHKEVSRIVAKYITTLPPQKLPSPSLKNSPTKSPQKPVSQDPLIIRTLRTTLQATEIPNVAHGPAWGVCVLSALIVLLGPAAMKIASLRSLAQLGLRHKNRSVRALTSIMWRCMVWVFLQPTTSISHDSDGEDEVEEVEEEVAVKREEQEKKQRDEWWKLVASVTEFEAGVSTIAATIGSVNPGVPAYTPPRYKYMKENEEDLPLYRALELLHLMVCKDAPTRASAIDTMKALVGVPVVDTETFGELGRRTLLPKSLFSALPGLLSTPFVSLKTAVNPIFEESPRAEDVRALTLKEVTCQWVWDGMMKAWKSAVGGADNALQGEEREKEKQDLLQVWEGLIGIGLTAVLDTGREIDPDKENRQSYDADAVANFTQSIIHVIEEDILENPHLRLSSSSSSVLSQHGLNIPGFTATSSDVIAKLSFARELWRIVYRLVPQAMLGDAAEQLIGCLMRNTDEYTTFTDFVIPEVRLGVREVEEEGMNQLNTAWTEFCLDALAVCGGESVRVFWGFCETSDECDAKTEPVWTCRWTATERAFVWRLFAKGWMEQVSEAGWEGAVCVLAVPFVRFESRSKGEELAWTLSLDDAELWQKLLEHTIATALDYGYDTNLVLLFIVTLVQSEVYMPVHIRLVELLLGYLTSTAQAGELRELPESVLEFATSTMIAAYPPSQDQTTYTWAARAMTTLFEQCPKELVGGLGEGMAEAVALWVGDAEGRWDSGVVEYDIIPMYQMILVTIQGLPLSPLTLQAFGPILCAPFGADARAQMRGPATDSFREFWDATYANVGTPEGGWSDEILICLNAVYGALEKPSPAVRAIYEPSPQVEQRPATPKTPTSSKTPLPHKPSGALSTPSRIRPRHSLRPFAQLPTNSPGSPLTSSPLAFKRRTSPESPAKRRKLASAEKENVYPATPEKTIPSVFERLGVFTSPTPATPIQSEKVSLGKRQLEEGVFDSDDEIRAVEELIGHPSSSDDDVFMVTRPTSTQVHSVTEPVVQKKRKRMILDAVEPPLLSEVYPRQVLASLRHTAIVTPTTMRVSRRTSSRLLRRAQSDTRAFAPKLADRNQGIDEADVSGSQRKRRRVTNDIRVFSNDEDEDGIGAGVTLLAPHNSPTTTAAITTPLQNWRRPLVNFDDIKARGFLWQLRDEEVEDLDGDVAISPSSEDDSDRLCIGQVTPHHLISPELGKRRGGGGSESKLVSRMRGKATRVNVVDPLSSDDSVVALSSPSTDLVKRRLRRYESF